MADENPMLEISGLHASAGGVEILKGIDLVVRPGEVHAVMGPNGSGKSTLANVLAGREDVQVTSGRLLYQGKPLQDLAPEDRAREGLFLAFQYPVEIPGVTNSYFMKASLNAVRKHRGQEPLDAFDFLALVREKLELVQMDEKFLNRAVNEGFSGARRSETRYSRWLCWSRALPSWTRPTRGSTSTPCASWPTA